MKMIPLTQGKHAIVSDGDFDWLNQWKWHAVNYRGKWYVERKEWPFNKTIRMHRFITNPPVGLEPDHINGNGLDNRRENLRLGTHAENLRNKKVKSCSTSGYKGVKVMKKNLTKKFRACIQVDGTYLHLGYYGTAELAARAYDEAAKKHHGVFASLNFPEG